MEVKIKCSFLKCSNYLIYSNNIRNENLHIFIPCHSCREIFYCSEYCRVEDWLDFLNYIKSKVIFRNENHSKICSQTEENYLENKIDSENSDKSFHIVQSSEDKKINFMIFVKSQIIRENLNNNIYELCTVKRIIFELIRGFFIFLA